MIDACLLERYRRLYGDTFNVDLWANRPGDAVNRMMRAVLTSGGEPITDGDIAAELMTRVTPPKIE